MKHVYVGCRTTKERNARGEGLSVYDILPDGSWSLKQCLFIEENPSYQCLDLEKKYLYSVHGDTTFVSSYKILEDGTLKHLNTIDIGGRNPVDVTMDGENKYVIVATLQGGTLFTIGRNPDGSLGEIIAKFTYEGKEEGKVSTVHQCLWDHTKSWMISCAQGRGNGFGQMRSLKYDAETGKFTEADRFYARTWDEPRHAAFHPNNKWLYMVEEKGNKVIFFSFDDKTGKLKALQELTTLPETSTEYSDASEVMIDPSGQWVIASNRYTDLMVTFRIDPLTGYLHTVSFCPCLGKTPRFFCFGPNGKCYVANEDSDTIVEMDFDDTTGYLLPVRYMAQTGSPVCICFD